MRSRSDAERGGGGRAKLSGLRLGLLGRLCVSGSSGEGRVRSAGLAEPSGGNERAGLVNPPGGQRRAAGALGDGSRCELGWQTRLRSPSWALVGSRGCQSWGVGKLGCPRRVRVLLLSVAASDRRGRAGPAASLTGVLSLAGDGTACSWYGLLGGRL